MKFWRANELRGGVTARELARATGRSEDAARSAAKRHGVALAPRHRGWPPKIRQKALRLRERGGSFGRVARAVGVPASTVRSWVPAADPLRAWMRKFRAYTAQRGAA